jgi:D-alanyl-D-alanine carboxypeptidase
MNATISFVLRIIPCLLAINALSLPTTGHMARAGSPADGDIFPETAGGRIAEEWFRAFNSGDAEVMSRFQLEHDSETLLSRMDEDRRRNMYLGVYGQTGRITPDRILKDEPARISVLARSEKGEWLEVELRFESDTGKIAGIMLRPSGPPGDIPLEGPMSESAALAGIKEALEDLTRNDEFSGTALIASDGDAVFAEPFGMANREFSVPNRIDTKFNIGSINKIFTKTAVAMLLSEGSLSLDDQIGDFLPEYANREAAEKVTVRHLVQMSSGIGDFFGEQFAATPKSRLRTLEDYLPLFAGEPLEFEPGTGNRYSNGGYIVLGLIIEKASGEDYYDYVRRSIFEPIGMMDTDSYEADEIVSNLACGYTKFGPEEEEAVELRRNIYTRPARGSSAGGGYSTAHDLLKFVNAVFSNALLPPEYNAWILGGPEPGGREQGDRDWEPGGIALAGGAPGINSYIDIGAPEDYTIIVMTNLDPPTAMRTGGLIRRWLDNIE